MSKSFAQAMTLEDNLMTVDALNLAFRWKHSGSTDFAEDYLRTVQSFRKSYKAKYVIITADQGSSSYRKAIYPEYKGNREELRKNQTQAEADTFKKFFEDYQEALDLIRVETDFPVLQYPKTEADDINAYILAYIQRKKLPIEHTWMISTDRDWDLLVSEAVSRFSYITRKEITANNWHEHYDFPQDDYISVKCLMGDDGDNIMGVEGIGPKRAWLLIEQYGSAYDIAANIPINSRYKYIQALNKCKDLILLNYQLMDLVTYCEDALGEHTKSIEEAIDNYVK